MQSLNVQASIAFSVMTALHPGAATLLVLVERPGFATSALTGGKTTMTAVDAVRNAKRSIASKGADTSTYAGAGRVTRRITFSSQKRGCATTASSLKKTPLKKEARDRRERPLQWRAIDANSGSVQNVLMGASLSARIAMVTQWKQMNQSDQPKVEGSVNVVFAGNTLHV